MIRPLRLEFPNVLHNITSRGDRREDIYEDAEDRLIFLSLLGKVVADFNWLCHGYCLMTNHYHSENWGQGLAITHNPLSTGIFCF
jgi:hypothetical protein